MTSALSSSKNLLKGGRFNTINHQDMSKHLKKHLSIPAFLLLPPQRRLQGKAIRFLRSNTDAHTYYSTLHKFALRGYPKDFNRNLAGITHDLRASYIPDLTPNTSPSPSPSPSTLRFVTTYRPGVPALHLLSAATVLYKHWSIVQNEPSLSTLFPAHPQLCYRRNRLPCEGISPRIPMSHKRLMMVRCTDK